MKTRLLSFLSASHIILILSLSLLIPGQGRVAEARVYLELNSPNIRRIPLAITPLQPLCGCVENEECASLGRKILIDDLEFSTFFEVIADSSLYLEKPGSCNPAADNFDFRNWSLIGAELLIRCGYCLSGDSLVTEFRLYDTLAGKMIIGKRYRGRRNNLRLLFHKFANQVVTSVTGLPGEFTSKIAFCGRLEKEEAQELYSCDYDGHERRRITNNGSINISPAWSSDADKLVFTSYRHDNPDLYLIDFLKGRESRLSQRKGLNTGASWSADDRLLVLMQRYDERSQISIITADSGKLIRQVTDIPANQASPCWSPDNRQLALVSDRSGSPQIYILPADGNNWRRLTRKESYNASPDWSAANDKIVFSAKIDNLFQICSIRPDGSEHRQLTYARGDCESPCWSPNGRHVLFTKKINGFRQLMVMDDKGREMRQLTFDRMEKKSPAWSANR